MLISITKRLPWSEEWVSEYYYWTDQIDWIFADFIRVFPVLVRKTVVARICLQYIPNIHKYFILGAGKSWGSHEAFL